MNQLFSRIPLPLHGWPLIGLAIAFLLPGLIGHDPWKTADAIGIGVVHQMLTTGNWLTPQLAGEAFLQDGPIYFWVSALFAKLLSFALPVHEGARFASTFFVVLALLWVRLAARELYGKNEGDLSMLALLGSVGLMWHAHEAAPEMAMLAGLAGAYYGLSISYRRPVKGGIFFGIGCSLAFLAKGLPGLAQPLLAALLVLPFCAEMRKRDFGFAVGLGLLVMLPFVLFWPWLLIQQAPAYFEEWWAWQFSNISNPPHLEEFLYYLKTLGWAAWPIWPLTLWAAWNFRKRLNDPAYAVPLVGAFVCLVLLMFIHSPNEMDALALLIPLAIPAGSAAVRLRRGAANALTWFAIMNFSMMAFFLWLMWFAALSGMPAKLSSNVFRLAPGFEFSFQWIAFIAAVMMTLGWLVLILRSERSTLRSLTHWAAGMTLCWGLAATLWLDWIDHGRSYRTVAQAARKQLPRHYTCIESRGLGISQRAVFDYHAGIVTKRQEVHGKMNCPYLLVETKTDESRASPGPQWRLIWTGNRPRDRERYRLYRKL
ncbi:MAG TPA: hypothetical protein VJM53_05640 [Burkholderiales bacterium]|nr:hypothetical protein [Burkholderiales bacterium]